MKQPTRARRTDPDTSHEFADHNTKQSPTIDALIVQCAKISQYQGVTSREVAEYTGQDRVSVSPRFKPLERMGKLKRTGEKRNKGQVWVLPEYFIGEQNELPF